MTDGRKELDSLWMKASIPMEGRSNYHSMGRSVVAVKEKTKE